MDLISILDEKAITYKATNNPTNIMIACTSGNHIDNDPSLSYDLAKNVFHCWSCGFKGGQTKFLQSIGITLNIPLETKQAFRIAKLRDKFNKIQDLPINLPPIRHNVVIDFHNVNLNTLKEFGTFTTTDMNLEDYICFPIHQYGKLRFIEARYKFSDKQKAKYQRKPYGVQSDDILFPLDRITQTKEIILVEGIFDLLNLWQHGITNVLCVFGTTNFGAKKAEILNNLNTISAKIMMDGDESGQQAAQRISTLLDQKFIKPTIIRLPSDKDPGVLQKYEIDYYLKNT